MASIKKREGEKTWRARYYDADRKLHEKRFPTKRAAQEWVREQETAVQKGRHVAPSQQKVTVSDWCDTWLASYRGAERTRLQARTHIALIKSGLGSHKLMDLKPSHVNRWLVELENQGRADSYRQAVLGRLRQIVRAAISDGLVYRNVATEVKVSTERRDIRLINHDQVWALHDAMPEHLRATVMLGAFAGLRVGEVCGLRVEHVDTAAHLVMPRVQYPDAPLKSKKSRTDIPIPETMSRQLAEHITVHAGGAHLFVNAWGKQLHPRVVERWFRVAREAVRAAEEEAGVPEHDRVPEDFRFHDLRHAYASYLIRAGLDVKIVQERMRHATATLTLDTYAGLWPEDDDGTRDVVGAAFAGRDRPTLGAVG